MCIIRGADGNSTKFLLLLLAILLIPSYAVAQKGLHSVLMKGNIVEIQNGKIYLCIGSRDGAAVGQELDVYNVGMKPMMYKEPPKFTRESLPAK